MNSESKSFISIFISGCLWGTIGLYVKLMESAGSSAPYTSFIRLLFGLFLLALQATPQVSLRQGGSESMKK